MRCARCSTSRIETPRSRISVERSEDRVDQGRRQTERRLVEQEHIGRGDERAADRELLLLAAGERAGLAMRGSRRASGRARTPRASGSEPLRRRRAESPSRRFSSTESSPKMRRPSGTSAIPARAIDSGERPRTDRPDRRTSPAAVRTTPMIACSVVDLPAPFGPIRPTSSPRPTSRSSPRTAGTEP